MRYKALVCLLLLCCFEDLYSVDECNKVELFGDRDLDGATLLEELSFVQSNGCLTDLQIDIKELKRECSDLSSKYSEIEIITCSPIFFGGSRKTIEVNVTYVEGQQHKFKEYDFSTIELDPSLSPIYVKHRETWFSLISKGINPGEHVVNSTLRYKNKSIDIISIEITDAIDNDIREQIPEVLVTSSLVNHRIAAAWMMPWTRPTDEIFSKTVSALLDPSQLVRNNYGRFLYLFIREIKNPEIIDLIWQTAITQSQLPYHSDRNKSMLILNSITENNGAICSEEWKKDFNHFMDIANRSSLDNVGGVARIIAKSLIENCDET